MYGVAGLRRSDEGTVQVLEEAVRCQSNRAQSTKANAAGVHGPARRAPGLRWQSLIQSFAIAASLCPASVSAVHARRLGRRALRRERCDCARMPCAALALAPPVGDRCELLTTRAEPTHDILFALRIGFKIVATRLVVGIHLVRMANACLSGLRLPSRRMASMMSNPPDLPVTAR